MLSLKHDKRSKANATRKNRWS